jgi:hypothetical protein
MQENAVVRFGGNCGIISPQTQQYQQTIRSLNDITGILSRLEGSNPKWHDLKIEVNRIANMFLNANQFKCPAYKLELLNQAILPYIRTMHGRYFLSKERFIQVTSILKVLFDQNNSNLSTVEVLHAVDKIINSIHFSGGFFASELESNLRSINEMQWKPILDDNRLVMCL